MVETLPFPEQAIGTPHAALFDVEDPSFDDSIDDEPSVALPNHVVSFQHWIDLCA